MSENESTELEVMQPSAIEAMERAQVDIQISTARKYGRVISAVKSRMLEYATLDEETAASCFYTLPARKGGDGQSIKGPSVRLAEIALASYQHVKAGARIISDDGKFITAQAVVHDLFNNVSVSIEVKRRVTYKDGKRFSDDMIATTGNAATSIALRNAVFRVVPRAIVMPVYEKAKQVAVGDVKSLVSKRAKIIERLGKMGVTVDRVLNAVGVAKVDDIGIEQMETLIGYGTSLKDGEYSIEELFPIPGSDKPENDGPVIKERKTRTHEKQETAVEQQQPEQQNAPTEQSSDPSNELSVNQNLLHQIVAESGGTFDDLIASLSKLAWFKDSSSWTSYAEIPDTSASRIIGAKRGIQTAIKEIVATRS